MEDLRKILQWSVKYWYIYVVCLLLCVAIGFIYLRLTPTKYKVNASVMLRTPSDASAQDRLISMMGVATADNTYDEIEVFSSSTLMEQVVDMLDIKTLYYAKNKGKWQIMYPAHPFSVILPPDCQTNVVITMTVKDGEYKLKVKDSRMGTKTYKVKNFNEPIKSHIGDILILNSADIVDGKYRAVCLQKQWAISSIKGQVAITRSSRESKIIHISSETSSPQLMRDVISTMLNLYSNQTGIDKTLVAAETDRFLKDRIAFVAHRLDSTEASLEAYKRSNHIADLRTMAENYRVNTDSYEQQLNKLDADLTLLDFVNQTLNQKDYVVIPRETGVEDATITDLIITYNKLIVDRQKLLQTATADNPQVVQITERLTQTKQTLLVAISQCRQSTSLTRQNVQKQYNLYSSRLQALPEQEKHYLELLRERNACEKQYVYLIEQQEANTLLLASNAIPAKIVERPTIYPESVSPNRKLTYLVAVILGIGIPIALFFTIILIQQLFLAPQLERKEI